MGIQSRRAGVLGVHSLDHFSFSVPNVQVARDFYRNFGLDVRDDGDDLDLRTFGHPHRWARVTQADRKALQYLSFGVFADDMPRFVDHLRHLGIAATEGRDHNAQSLWVADPHGVPIEIRVAEKSSPNSKAERVEAAPSMRGAPMREEAVAVHPRRLSHVAFFTPDLDASLDFFTRVLGMRLSDRSGPAAFLHGVHGSEHHMIALIGSNAPGYHHSAWDVGSIDEVGQGWAQMAHAGYKAGWGLGRHVLGSNYFHYVRDPWGSYSEYSFDIDFVPATLDWPSAEVPPENSMFLWGPMPPDDFGVNFEAEKTPQQR